MIYTLDDFIREYTKICAMGWIKTHRSGPTGIGKTLEDLLGIVENNIDGPDFGDYELKSCRLDSNSMLTIFTRTPQPQQTLFARHLGIPVMLMTMMRRSCIPHFLLTGLYLLLRPVVA